MAGSLYVFLKQPPHQKETRRDKTPETKRAERLQTATCGKQMSIPY